MDFKENLENLSKDIQDIGKLVENLVNNSNVSLVDLDLLKARVHDLYDSVIGVAWKIKLDKTMDSVKDDKPAVQTIEKIDEREEEPEIEKIEMQDPVNIDVREEEPAPEKIVMDDQDKVEAKEEEIVEIIEDKQEDLPAPPLSNSERSENSGVLSDKYQNRQNYRNEALKKENPVHDIASKFHDQPIPDIGAAIGINEKFRYIRELFDGNSSLYIKTIDDLNNVESEADAISYLQQNFSWDPEEKLAKNLLDLTRRKLKNQEND